MKLKLDNQYPVKEGRFNKCTILFLLNFSIELKKEEDKGMKILHYALGFPPYRTGGLTKFCMDIMQQQKQLGHDIALMWPGQIKLYNKSVQIKHKEDNSGITSFEIINPLPISYDEGITRIEAFKAECNKKAFVDFLKNYQPDKIHIHSLMGLHREFVEVANSLGIRIVFSVHDFFTVCPKVTMFHKGAVCETAKDCLDCAQCNLTALSIMKIMILQSPMYRTFKDSILVKKLRKNHRDQYLSGKSGEEVEYVNCVSRTASDYKNLREYYGSMVSMMDTVHYNSTVTKTVFERFFTVKNSQVISITHADIRDNRRIKEFTHSLRMTYLGPQGGAKGFFYSRRLLMNYG